MSGKIKRRSAVQNTSSTKRIKADSPNESEHAALPFKNPDYVRKKDKNLKQILNSERASEAGSDVPTYYSIQSPPTMKPTLKYCDLSGLPALYTDPKTKLRYHAAAHYQHIQTLPDETVKAYLGLRNATNMLFLH